MHINIFSQVSSTNGISRPLQESQIFSIEPICILPLNLIFMAGSTGYIPPHRRKNSAAANASMERQMAAITLQSQASSEQVPSTPTQHSNTVPPFFLPRLVREHYDECCQSRNNDAYLDHDNENHDFSLHNLAWAIQNDVDEKCIERYLTQQNEAVLADMLCQPIQTSWGTRFFPILYFAAERNSPQIVRILCHAGADPSQRITRNGATATGLPLLPYSILTAEYQLSDTTDTVVALLAMGADPHDVPQDMWQDYLKPATKDAPNPSPQPPQPTKPGAPPKSAPRFANRSTSYSATPSGKQHR